MNLSLCICTYQRAEQLKQSLRALQNCASEFIDGDEVIVVDNNSSDNTAEIVQLYKGALPIRYAFEATQGLSAARNRALAEFSNDLLIFIDDDVSVLGGFIDQYRRAAIKHTGYQFFGGKIHVHWQNGKPKWLKSDNLPLLNGLFVHYDLGDTDLAYTQENQLTVLSPYGANFALRRSLIEQIGNFDTSLGVKGKEIGRSEESDYFERALAVGQQGYYLAQAKVLHRFTLSRLALPYLYKYGKAKGFAAARHSSKSNPLWFLSAALFALRGLYQLLKGRQDRFYQCVINIGIERGLFLANR